VSSWRAAGPPRRRDTVWTLVAALAGLGVVVNAAAPRTALSPVIATAMNVRWIGTREVLSAGLLVAAALAVVGLGVAESLRGRLHGPPAATADTGPVGQGP
jgi:hypothetical protein